LRKPGKTPLPQDEVALFREAVRGAVPLRVAARAPLQLKSPPPVRSPRDSHDALAGGVSGPVALERSVEAGEELTFLRNGLGRDVLRKMRRGHWVVQNELDLHGLNSEQARLLLAEFIGRCSKRGARCVRVVHGKGLRSPNREPVLKGKLRQWLAQRDEVLAYCQAPADQGGSGALLVLLKA